MMTLWSIARSPLMHGGDMTKTDDATLALLTNDEVLAVNQHSVNNRPLFNHDQLIAWTADVPDSPDKYLAVFNTRDRVRLTPENARYVSALVTRDPATAAEIDIDVAGATKLFLLVDPIADGENGDRILLCNPRFVFAGGVERPLTDFPWTHVDATWDSTSVKNDATGKAIGITALATAVIEYSLPAGAIRFKGTGTVEQNGADQVGGTVRFLVIVSSAETENSAARVPVAVKLTDLGFTGSAHIHDLWTHRDLGQASGEFAPEIPFHGSGLYRLSPE